MSNPWYFDSDPFVKTSKGSIEISKTESGFSVKYRSCELLTKEQMIEDILNSIEAITQRFLSIGVEYPKDLLERLHYNLNVQVMPRGKFKHLYGKLAGNSANL